MRHFGIHLNALRAFEAAARLSSFSLAAKELNVSHSTISHHIKGLESTIGVELFLRQNRSVVLTEAGETLFPILERSFDEISLTLETLKEKNPNNQTIRVTSTPSFATKWLLPRLRHFRDAHPDIEVALTSSLSLTNFSHERCDVALRTGLGDWSGLNAELLMPIHMTPLCSPSFIDSKGSIKNAQDLNKCTLIHADVDKSAGIESEWREWLVATGFEADVDSGHGLSFHDPSLALQAAVNGLGIAMGYIELAEDELTHKKLVQPFQEQIKHPWSYYIVTPKDRTVTPQQAIFCDWLRAEASS